MNLTREKLRRRDILLAAKRIDWNRLATLRTIEPCFYLASDGAPDFCGHPKEWHRPGVHAFVSLADLLGSLYAGR